MRGTAVLNDSHLKNMGHSDFFFQFFLLEQSPFRGATDCTYFALCVTLPMGFKARVDLWPAISLACVQ